MTPEETKLSYGIDAWQHYSNMRLDFIHPGAYSVGDDGEARRVALSSGEIPKAAGGRGFVRFCLSDAPPNSMLGSIALRLLWAWTSWRCAETSGHLAAASRQLDATLGPRVRFATAERISDPPSGDRHHGRQSESHYDRESAASRHVPTLHRLATDGLTPPHAR